MDTHLQAEASTQDRTKFTLLRNALFMPLDGTMEAFTSGVFVDGQCHPDSLQSRCTPAEPCAPEAVLRKPCLFGGYLFWHYGHFILESLSRLYALAQCPDLPVLFATPNSALAQWQRQLLRLLNVRNEIIFVKKPTLVETLILSPPGSAVERFITPAQLAALGKGAVPPLQPDLKIWLSRSHLQCAGGIENEPEIEEQLEQMGWKIVHPQTLPLSKQVALLGSAAHVAGFDGSAFFTSLLAQQVHGQYTIFGRRNFIARAISYSLAQKGIRMTPHVFPVQHVSGEEALARFRLDTPELLLQTLQEVVSAKNSENNSALSSTE